MKSCSTATLDSAGLNRQAVFNLDEMPADIAGKIRSAFDPDRRYRQLILIGHAGRTLWSAVKASGIDSDNPIDDFTSQTVEQWFAEQFGNCRHKIVYPGDGPIGLQALGKLAGWHHTSPFMIGIDGKWGTWYAYRAVLLADTDMPPTHASATESPCDTCHDKVCIASCPGGALGGGEFELNKCVTYRKQPSSLCKTTCLARVSCPVGAEHRYSEDQIRHTYVISMRTIEQYY